jgi:hypothetical protein
VVAVQCEDLSEREVYDVEENLTARVVDCAVRRSYSLRARRLGCAYFNPNSNADIHADATSDIHADAYPDAGTRRNHRVLHR